MKISVDVVQSEFCDDESLLMDIVVEHAYPEGGYTALNITARAKPDFHAGELVSVSIKAERLMSYEQDGEFVAAPTMFCDYSTEQLVREHRNVEEHATQRYQDDFRAWVLDRSV